MYLKFLYKENKVLIWLIICTIWLSFQINHRANRAEKQRANNLQENIKSNEAVISHIDSVKNKLNLHK